MPRMYFFILVFSYSIRFFLALYAIIRLLFEYHHINILFLRKPPAFIHNYQNFNYQTFDNFKKMPNFAAEIHILIAI